jgi:hypothetical protein
MPELPRAPIPPAEFLEDFVPRRLADLAGERGWPETDLALGVELLGDEGGEWILRVRDGRLDVAREARCDATATLVQSVEDWRGAIWEGRGGIFGRAAVSLLSGRAPAALRTAAAGGRAGALALLEPVRALDGLVRVVLAGDAGGDWSLGVRLGPGTIPDEADATVTIGASDAAAMERRELDPLTAFMAGRIQVVGDLALVLRIQAAAMQAMAPPPR